MLEIMSNETWYLGNEAVEQGFADELIGLDLDLEIENKGNSKFMIVNKLEFDVTNYKNAPQKIINKVNKKVIKNTQINKKLKKEGVKAMDLKELQENHPDLYNQVKNTGYEEGIKTERERIKNIEEIAPKGYESLVNKAKFEDGMSAETLAVNIIKAQKDSGVKYLNEVKEDAEELEEVEPSEDEDKEEKKEEKAVNALVGAVKNRRR